MASYATQRKRVGALRWIGFWATWWWAVSGAYIVLLVWESRNETVVSSGGASLSDWLSAISSTFTRSAALQLLLVTIILVWVIGGLVWLRELKRHKITYKTALKDLLLTIRR